MLFNSFEFLIFLPVVLLVYYQLSHHNQNRFLVVASCYFYASWDWRFLAPLLFSTTIDFYCARQMERSIEAGGSHAQRKRFLVLSLVTNLGLLAFFKYCNFFVDSFHDLMLSLGVEVPMPALNVILPIGISFYTFQALSYTIDVYRGQVHAVRSFWDFFLAVLFFPHLVAGPIQRAGNLLKQVMTPRRTTAQQWQDGIHLIIWGYFKKVFIADGLAPIANAIFASASPPGGEVIIGVLAFAFQIYCDFSGYTDIARGVAKLMGFEFMLNFNLPYLARNPPDFWRRWHISLSTWLRDYLYISLGGNRGSSAKTYRNLMATMVIGGLWHGAAWNYVLWGAYHGAILVGHRLVVEPLQKAGRVLGRVPRPLKAVFCVLCMFVLTCYGWLLFRATSLAQIGAMTGSLLRAPLAGWPTTSAWSVLLYASPLVAVQMLQWRQGRLDFMRQKWLPFPAMVAVYAVMGYLILFRGGAPQAFVYFQF